MRYAAENGADIVSMSFGGSTNSSSFQAIFNSFPDVLFIAAAGNDYGEVIRYPCAYDNVYCVAASTCADQKTRFSNYGTQVDITAPGDNILSTMPSQSYKPLQGTSMATPLVSSLA